MSAQRTSGRVAASAAAPDPAYRRPEMGRLRARRAAARRRQRLARLDLGIGVLAALVLLLISPGLAITAIVALLVLVACAASVVVEWRRRRAPDTPAARLRRTGRSLPRAKTAAPASRRPTRTGR